MNSREVMQLRFIECKIRVNNKEKKKKKKGICFSRRVNRLIECEERHSYDNI